MDSMNELEKLADRLLGERTDLQRKNRNLTARVKKLEKLGQVSGDTEKLERERDELKRRVERLVERLESLAAED